MVLGYDFGRVFPAGVRLDLINLQEIVPIGCLRDSAGRLRRGGGLVGRGWCLPGAHLPECQLGALREEVVRKMQVALSQKA